MSDLSLYETLTDIKKRILVNQRAVLETKQLVKDFKASNDIENQEKARHNVNILSSKMTLDRIKFLSIFVENSQDIDFPDDQGDAKEEIYAFAGRQNDILKKFLDDVERLINPVDDFDLVAWKVVSNEVEKHLASR